MPPDEVEELLDSLPGLGARTRSRLQGHGAQAEKVSVIRLKAAHHRLASLIAAGLSNQEVGALTGYAPNYIRDLHGFNPAFQELVAYYTTRHEQELLDVRAKQARLGELAIDELTDRLTELPDSFTNNELLAVVESATNRPRAVELAAKHPLGPLQPAAVNIQFVTTDASGAVIEHHPRSPKLESPEES